MLRIDNRQARHLWLSVQGLARTPTGSLDLMGVIRGLGFVQLDTIQVVARAHHHILWSRNQNYREPMLDRLLARDRAVFEHFTHDASVLPMEFLPMWRRQFRRKQAQLDRAGWFRGLPDATEREKIKDRIRREGALSTHAFDTKVEGVREMWARPPHKKALDYMWYSGELATCHRDGFTKVYDLAERVFAPEHADVDMDDAAQVDWLCRAALERIGVGTAGEIQQFWDATDLAEVKDWCAAQPDLQEVEVQSAAGNWQSALAPMDIEDRLEKVSAPTSRLRILNPFDPAVRDRKRLYRLFGFEYRNEMFVPKAKRVWGYYVFPILEGDRFVGRIELKADRKAGTLTVVNFWPETDARWGTARFGRLDAELGRLSRFVGVEDLHWAPQAAQKRAP
ncbi:crosslink repair DNA glycosylase YcaQ family protein [Shimia sp. SDUM112013]|uniref:winged helix-turn-helix domain-containing protein n=1 Tax=Shimia sp. SDUM112013 TaxID=3136160 RepID=UPI0032EF5072